LVFVVTAVSAPLLDVLASAAVEQPPLQMPTASSTLEPQSAAGNVAESEPMPTAPAEAQAPVSTAPVFSVPIIATSTPRFVSCFLVVGVSFSISWDVGCETRGLFMSLVIH